MDFVQSLDSSKLVLAETILSFSISPFTAPVYNLPIFLFGLLAQENPQTGQSLQIFTGLLGISAVFDIIYMSRNDQHGLIRLITIFILLFKIPTFLAFGSSLREVSGRIGSLGGFPGSEQQGATVWSMPGGFGQSNSRDGYQAMDEESVASGPVPPSKPAPPPRQPPHVSNVQPQAPGGYQSV